MGEGMRRLARLCGGLTVTDKHGTVRYDAGGRVKCGSIAFCDTMMLALLAGRKTVTRRMRPKGAPGDVLWVKEALIRVTGYEVNKIAAYGCDSRIVVVGDEPKAWPWKRATLPAMFCPRWASRVSIRLIDVRQEHLSQITEDDARREGFESRNQFLELFRRLHPELSADVDPIVYRHAFEVLR